MSELSDYQGEVLWKEEREAILRTINGNFIALHACLNGSWVWSEEREIVIMTNEKIVPYGHQLESHSCYNCQMNYSDRSRALYKLFKWSNGNK